MSDLLKRIDPDGTLYQAIVNESVRGGGRIACIIDRAIWKVLAERGLLRDPAEPTLAEIREKVEAWKAEAEAELREMLSYNRDAGSWRGKFVAYDAVALLEPRKPLEPENAENVNRLIAEMERIREHNATAPDQPRLHYVTPEQGRDITENFGGSWELWMAHQYDVRKNVVDELGYEHVPECHQKLLRCACTAGRPPYLEPRTQEPQYIKPGSWIEVEGKKHMVCYDEGEYVVILDGYETRPVLRSLLTIEAREPEPSKAIATKINRCDNCGVPIMPRAGRWAHENGRLECEPATQRDGGCAG